MTREEFRDYVDFLRSQDEISYDVYSGLIDGIDTLEQESKTGHWIYKNLKGQFCSICDEQSVWKFNYCPNCGAKMVEPKERSE